MAPGTRPSNPSDHPSPTDKRVDDDVLVRAVRSGDLRVFSTLFRASYAELWRYARAITRSAESAEEVVDDVFAWLWANRAEWAPASTVRAYLFRAVRNRALNAAAATRSAERIADAATREVDPVAMGEANALQDDALVLREMDDAVWAAINALSPDARQVMVLRWESKMSWAEVAEIMGVSIAAVQMKHTRALRLLKARLPHLLD